MHLVGLTTSYPLRDESSAGVFVRRLYENLPEPWQVDVVCPCDASDNVIVSKGRIRVHAVRYAPRRWRVLAQSSGGIAVRLREAPLRLVLVPVLIAALWWRCIVVSRRAHLLHANWAICGAIAALVSLMTRCPVVTTLRGDDVTRAEHSLLDRWLLRLAVRGSATIVCVSEAMALRLREQFPGRSADIRVCFNGVDPSFLFTGRTSPRPGHLRVVAVGSLIERKGFDILIRALARMKHRDGVSLRVAGEGPERDSLLELSRNYHLLKRVDLHGHIPPSELPDFLKEADVFVLSSRSEGRPNVVVEALASGLPVICSDLPGVKDLVVPGVNGWLVPVEDVAGFAAALDEAYSDPQERERRGNAARARILAASHGWDATGFCYHKTFQDALSG